MFSRKQVYLYRGKRYLRLKELAVDMGVSSGEISKIVKRGMFKGEEVKCLNIEAAKDKSNFVYHTTRYTSLDELGFDYALSPEAIKRLESVDITEPIVKDVINEDRKLWGSKNLILEGVYVGTVGKYIEESCDMYIELMREYFYNTCDIYGSIRILDDSEFEKLKEKACS